LCVNALIFSLAAFYLVERLTALAERFVPGWLEWLLWPLLLVAVLAMVAFGFSFLANLIATPFNDRLSLAVQRRLTGQGAGGARPVAKAWLSELGKLAHAALCILPVAVLFLVPGLQLLATPLWFLVAAWLLALEYADYPMGNDGLDARTQRALLARHRPLALGFGLAALALTLIPVINCIAMPAAVAGATALWIERLRPTGRPSPG
jgi:CysZ protein